MKPKVQIEGGGGNVPPFATQIAPWWEDEEKELRARIKQLKKDLAEFKRKAQAEGVVVYWGLADNLEVKQR